MTYPINEEQADMIEQAWLGFSTRIVAAAAATISDMNHGFSTPAEEKIMDTYIDILESQQ